MNVTQMSSITILNHTTKNTLGGTVITKQLLNMKTSMSESGSLTAVFCLVSTYLKSYYRQEIKETRVVLTSFLMATLSYYKTSRLDGYK